MANVSGVLFAVYLSPIGDSRRSWKSSLFIRMFTVTLLCDRGSSLTRNRWRSFYLNRLWTRMFIMVKRLYSM